MRILVSVRDAAEARMAAAAGVDFIDLKDPAAGALGGLSCERIRAILHALAGAGHAAPVSATIGDLPATAADAAVLRAIEVAACGVDLVKVGVSARGGAAERALIERLAGLELALVPVLIADAGLCPVFAREVLGRNFAAVMLDTQAKRRGSLLSMVSEGALRDFLALARQLGRPAGLAGALRLDDVPALQRLAPDFAGFRSAVCEDGRAGALSRARLEALLAARALAAV